MKSFNPKIEIINHFDKLINRVDIDIETCLEKYNENQVLGELKCFHAKNRYIRENQDVVLVFFNSRKQILKNEYEGENNWSESTKVVDYLNQVRMRTIEELRKAQEDSLEYFKSNSSQFNTITDLEEFKRRFFAEKYYFQVLYKDDEKYGWIFNLYTFVTDFYMSPSDIELLQ
jgi:hypothetical protein